MRIGTLAAVTVLLAMVGCARSAKYKEDQQYYKDDSGYASKAGSATARADRFGQPKKRVYVLGFQNSTPVGGVEFGDFAADELLRQIRERGRAVVPENVRVSDRSDDFFSGDKVRLGPLVREGRRLGVSMLIVGRIKRITYRTKGDDVGLFRQKKAVAAVDLEMRLIDVINSKEVLLDEKSADSSASHVNIFNSDDEGDPKSQRAELVRMALRAGSELFSKDLSRALEKLSWEGRIAKISGNQVYINAGRATGLGIGDILKVMTVGEDVYDPVTGAYLGRARGQPKGTLEVVDYLGADGAVAVVHSGGNFSENDIVQLY
jgi:hypothetical protein